MFIQRTSAVGWVNLLCIGPIGIYLEAVGDRTTCIVMVCMHALPMSLH